LRAGQRKASLHRSAEKEKRPAHHRASILLRSYAGACAEELDIDPLERIQLRFTPESRLQPKTA
jgi:hypothetical protein